MQNIQPNQSGLPKGKTKIEMIHYGIPYQKHGLNLYAITRESILRSIKENPEATMIFFNFCGLVEDPLEVSDDDLKVEGLLEKTQIKTASFSQINHEMTLVTDRLLSALPRRMDGINLSLQNSLPEDVMIALTKFHSIRALLLDEIKLKDEFKYINQINIETSLSLDRAIFYPQDLSFLRESKIKQLQAQHTLFNDESCEFLREHPTIDTLFLMNTDITDKGMEILSTIPNLQELYIEECYDLTDAAIDPFLEREVYPTIYSTTDFGVDHYPGSTGLEIYYKGRECTDAVYP